MSTIMKEEILATPRLLANTKAGCAGVCAQVAELIKERHINRIFLVGRGSSENAGVYFRYLCEISCHIPVTIINPSVITLYGSGIDMTDGLLIAVSQGGRGLDIRMVVEEAVSHDVPTVAVTNFPDSPVGELCDYVLPLGVELEQSMSATKTFTAEMYALYLLSRAILGKAAAPGLPEAFENGLSQEKEIAAGCTFFDSDKPCYVLGRGKLLALARETCCKLQETCLVNAFPFSAADFMHGPFALIGKGSRALVLHTKYACIKSTTDLISSLLSQGAEVLVITDDEALTGPGCRIIRVNTASEDESVFAMTAVIQLLAAELSELRGTNPDAARHLSKYRVTI